MSLLKKDPEKTAAKEAARLARAAARAAAEAVRRKRDDNPEARWEYKVIRIHEDKMKGLAGSGYMERELKKLGSQGWELVSIYQERAVFKRKILDFSDAEREDLADVSVGDSLGAE